MNKTIPALILGLALLVSMLIGKPFINKVEADTLGPLFDRSDELSSSGITIEINSPQNTTYSTDTILLNFTIAAYGSIYDVGYSIDGGAIERVTNLTKISEVPVPSSYLLLPPYVRVTYIGSVALTNLLKGSHTITVYDGFQYQDRYESFEHAHVTFTVDTPTPTPTLPNFGPTTSPTPSLNPKGKSIQAFVLIGIVITAVVCVGLLVYFRKHKR